MTLIVLEGLDRTGKSTLAKKFESEGYEIIHMSAPSKKYREPGYTGPSYLDDMMDLLHHATTRDIVLDRSHYGELIWPHIYSRDAALNEEDIETLREMEEAVGVRRILMHDPDVESHWNRCVANNEPLTRPQFLRARTLYERMAKQYGFEKIVLTDIPEFKITTQSSTATPDTNMLETKLNKSKEQLKLEKANAINDVLSKRIIKGKNEVYDEIETEVRLFLNNKLGTILGSEMPDSFSKEEMYLLRALINRLKEKENK
jgi:dephospho-CoA kinase